MPRGVHINRDNFAAHAASRRFECQRSAQARARLRAQAQRLGVRVPEWAAAEQCERASSNWGAWCAARLAAHEAASNSVGRASIRKKVRDRARELEQSAPTWALAVERSGTVAARQKNKRWGTPRRKPRASKGAALATLAPGEVARPLALPAELGAWRARTPFAVVQMRSDGRVVLADIEHGSRRTFASVIEAVKAVAA